MSTINKALSGILFNGADLDLASAGWKGKVSALYGFNAAGNGYTVFKPASAFNSLTKLVQDGAYIVAASTPGFELPGATLTAAAVVPTLTLELLQYGVDPDTSQPAFNLLVTSNVASDTTCKAVVVAVNTAAPDNVARACANYVNLPVGSEAKLPEYAIANTGTIDQDSTCWLFVTAPSGATLFHEFFYNDPAFWG